MWLRMNGMIGSDGPTFVCIGAPKSGTTWLWDNLRGHPDVWVPPIKEMHWFDLLYPPAELGDRVLFRHRVGVRRFGPAARERSFRTLLWLKRFYGAVARRDGYCELFDRRWASVMGDLTPLYCILDGDAVAKVYATLPKDCKILYVVREPVERLWSALRMHCRNRGFSVRDLSIEEIDQMSCLPEQVLQADYARAIRNWSIFGDRFSLLFYEDLVDDAESFLAHVLSVLGLDPSWRSSALNKVSNEGERTSGPPPLLLTRWRERFRPTVDSVLAQAGRVPASWVYETDAIG